MVDCTNFYCSTVIIGIFSWFGNCSWLSHSCLKKKKLPIFRIDDNTVCTKGTCLLSSQIQNGKCSLYSKKLEKKIAGEEACFCLGEMTILELLITYP